MPFVLMCQRTIRIAPKVDIVLVFVAAVLFDQTAHDADANNIAMGG